MAVYSISELEELTGVKAPTIRMWEKRYSLVTPRRTSTNIRYYNDEDLKTIIHAALLNENGFRISKIASMDRDTLMEHVTSITSVEMSGEEQADVLSLSLIDFNLLSFQHIIQKNILTLGFEKTMLEVIYPFMEKVGLLWLSGAMNQAHEKFLNNALREILYTQINLLPHPTRGPQAILFLPMGNQQELSLLFAQYLFKKNGVQTINLGVGCEAEDVIMCCAGCPTAYVFTVNIDEQDLTFMDTLRLITSNVQQKVVVSGNAIELLAMDHFENLIRLDGLNDTMHFIPTMKSQKQAILKA